MVIATGCRAEGHREVLEVEIGNSENETFWTEFLRGLVDRGLFGVQLVISDAQAGLVAGAAGQPKPPSPPARRPGEAHTFTTRRTPALTGDARSYATPWTRHGAPRTWGTPVCGAGEDPRMGWVGFAFDSFPDQRHA